MTIDDIKRKTTAQESGCWRWHGAKDKDGYGYSLSIYRELGTRAVHRASFLLVNGWLPKFPLVLDHICDNRACVNPAHLRVLNNVENSNRGIDAKRSPTCPLGHNRWRIRGGGYGRECLDCRNIWKKRYRARKKAGLVKPRASSLLPERQRFA